MVLAPCGLTTRGMYLWKYSETAFSRTRLPLRELDGENDVITG